MTYFLLLSINFFSQLVAKSRIHYLLYAITSFFILTAYYNGSDWRYYEIIYDGQVDVESRFEFLWPLLFEAFNNIGFSFHEMLLVLKLAVFCALIVIAKKFDINFKIFFPIFTTVVGIGLFIDNPIRQMGATPFYALSLLFFYRRMRYWGVLTVILGSFFHESLILILPFYFLRIGFSPIFHLLLYIALLIIFVMGGFEALSGIIIALQAINIHSLGYYARHYFEDVNSGVGGGFIVYTLCLIILIKINLILKKKSMIKWGGASLLETHSFIFIYVGMLSNFIPQFNRLNYYFGFAMALYLATLYVDKRLRNYILLLAGFFVVITLNIVARDYRYIPYTNYIYAVISSDLKSYYYRNNFHLNYKGWGEK